MNRPLLPGDPVPDPNGEPNRRFRRKLQTFWEFTEGLGRLSCCKRLGVGCIVVTPDLTEVLSVGYNGPPAGRPNDGCREAEGACGCVHGESTAMAKLSSHRDDLVLLVTTSPCELCAGLVVNSQRVLYVVYGVAYRDPRGIDLLRKSGVVVRSAAEVGLTPSGMK